MTREQFHIGIIFALLIFTHFSQTHAIPKWVQSDSHFQKGNIYRVTCSGRGPAVDIARNEAIKGCISSAALQVQSSFKVKSVTVETEKSTGYHQEIAEDKTVSGLSCNQIKEEIEDTGSGFQVWVQCEFDLRQATIIDEPPTKSDNAAQPNDPSVVVNKAQLGSVAAVPVQQQNQSTKTKTAERRTLTVSTVPQCDSIIIRGRYSRTLDCHNNPMTLVLRLGDEQAIVRARGYRPKTIVLNPESTAEGSIRVILEAN